MEIVLVKWEDAFGCPEGWQMLDEVERETSLVQSVGFVAAETETTLTRYVKHSKRPKPRKRNLHLSLETP